MPLSSGEFSRQYPWNKLRQLLRNRFGKGFDYSIGYFSDNLLVIFWKMSFEILMEYLSAFICESYDNNFDNSCLGFLQDLFVFIFYIFFF